LKALSGNGNVYEISRNNKKQIDMSHQFYFKQRVIVKQGAKIYRGYVANFDEETNHFEVQTDYGAKYHATPDYIEPDYGLGGQPAKMSQVS